MADNHGQDGKVAIVTGASRGIGRAVAEHLHSSGYHVLTSSRQSLDALPNRWHHVVADLGSEDGVAAVLEHPLASDVSVLVNNVGAINAFGGIQAETGELVRATFATNLFGPLESCRRLAPALAATQGSIINISSIYGSISPAPPVLSYAASKAALSAVTQSLALELGPTGVRVNAILPGNIDTDMTRGGGDEFVNQVIDRTPLGRLGETSEISHAITFLIDAKFVTGHLLVIDGGISLVGG